MVIHVIHTFQRTAHLLIFSHSLIVISLKCS